MTELPNRPKPSPDDQHTIIDPKDRVKSAHDKPDPRFEAARQKAAREEEVRAQQAERAAAASDEDADAVEDADRPETTSDRAEPKGTFSFNMTAGEQEEDA